MHDTSAPAPHPVDQILPPQQMATYGLQHVLVLYAGAVAVPLILGGALGLTAAQVVLLINANLLTSGVATLIQTLGFWKFGARLPLVQACSFIALAPMIMIGKEYGVQHVFGAVIAGGAITVALAPVTSRLLRFFPPVVIGSLITIIGITLMPAAAIWLGGGNPDAKDFGAWPNLALGLFTIAVTLVVYARFSGFLGNLAVLVGLAAGTAVATAFGLTDFSQVGAAAWFELSAPFAFGAPQFGLAPALIMALAMLVIMAETTGNCLAIGLFPKLGALIASVPRPVLGGCAVVMFGMTTVAGIQELARVKFEGTRNALVVAVSVSVGVLPMSFPALFAHASGPLKLVLESGIFLGAITAVLLNLILNRSEREQAVPEGATATH